MRLQDNIGRALARMFRFRSTWRYITGVPSQWNGPYKAWVDRREPKQSEFPALRAECSGWAYRPKISIITLVQENGSRKYEVSETVRSVLDQVYDAWDLLVVSCLDKKPGQWCPDVNCRSQDRRVKMAVIPRDASVGEVFNTGLTGEFVVFLAPGTLLAPFALFEVVRALNESGEIDVLYSDEDKVHMRSGVRFDPFFKPEWAPDTMLSHNYMTGFCVVRRALLEQVGGIRDGFDGAREYDLILRLAERTNRIRRLPMILHHRVVTDYSVGLPVPTVPSVVAVTRRAITDHLSRRGVAADVLDGHLPGTFRVRYRVKGSPKVSIIIPSRDRVELLEQALRSILSKTRYPNFEVLIVDNQSVDPATHAFYDSIRDLRNIRILEYEHSFNFAAINNFAATSVDAEHLVFLNNDTEVIEAGWLLAMLEYAQKPDVGAVGAKLYYPGELIQHAGVAIGVRGLAAHLHQGSPRSSSGYMGRLKLIQNVSAVTAACMMVPRNVFEAVGGFDEKLSHVFNDVDLCLKIRARGLLIVWTPYAELYHRESASGASRGHEATREGRERFQREKDYVKRKWDVVLASGDPYYSPNLTHEKLDVSIREP